MTTLVVLQQPLSLTALTYTNSRTKVHKKRQLTTPSFRSDTNRRTRVHKKQQLKPPPSGSPCKQGEPRPFGSPREAGGTYGGGYL